MSDFTTDIATKSASIFTSQRPMTEDLITSKSVIGGKYNPSNKSRHWSQNITSASNVTSRNDYNNETTVHTTRVTTFPILPNNTKSNQTVFRKKRQATSTSCPVLDSSKSYFLQNVETKLFMDTDQYSLLILNSFNKTSCTQQWSFVKTEPQNNTFQLLNRGSKKVLTYSAYVYTAPPLCGNIYQRVELQQYGSDCVLFLSDKQINLVVTAGSNAYDAKPMSQAGSLYKSWAFIEAEKNLVNENTVACSQTSCITNPTPNVTYTIINSQQHTPAYDNIYNVRFLGVTCSSKSIRFDTYRFYFHAINLTSNIYKICSVTSQKCAFVNSSVTLLMNATTGNDAGFEFQIIEENGKCILKSMATSTVMSNGAVMSISTTPTQVAFINSSAQDVLSQRYWIYETESLSPIPPFLTRNCPTNMLPKAFPAGSACSCSSYDNKAQLLESLSIKLNLENITDDTAKTVILTEALAYFISSLTEQERISFGYRKADLIIKCWFNGKLCDIEKDFVLTNDLSLGNCFTFNHQTLDEKYFSKGPGIQNGLSILLKVSQKDYMPTSTFAGIKVFVSDREVSIFPDSDGASISPGFNADFLLDYSEIHRLPLPYGNCSNEIGSENYFYNGQYSYEGCIRSCYQKQVLKQCGCGDPRFPFLKTSKNIFLQY